MIINEIYIILLDGCKKHKSWLPNFWFFAIFAAFCVKIVK